MVRGEKRKKKMSCNAFRPNRIIQRLLVPLDVLPLYVLHVYLGPRHDHSYQENSLPSSMNPHTCDDKQTSQPRSVPCSVHWRFWWKCSPWSSLLLQRELLRPSRRLLCLLQCLSWRVTVTYARRSWNKWSKVKKLKAPFILPKILHWSARQKENSKKWAYTNLTIHSPRLAVNAATQIWTQKPHGALDYLHVEAAPHVVLSTISIRCI